MKITTILMIVNSSAVVLTILRVMLYPRRDPEVRIAWIAVIAALPIFGILTYFLFGEVDIGQKRLARMHEVTEILKRCNLLFQNEDFNKKNNLPKDYQDLFKLGKSIGGFNPVDGNSAKVIEDSDSVIDSLVNDIDKATEHVHLLFYIWLPDKNGLKVVEALKRAANRGVKCRVLVDNLGSQTIIQSKEWSLMKESGAELAISLPMFKSSSKRFDLRNHRKIIVIDGKISYCGSQNCCDAEFLPKANYAPWVDLVLRLEGPIVQQNQYLFISDWMITTNKDISELLEQSAPTINNGFTAQVIGTGPPGHNHAMSQIFLSLISSARKELIITTPYFVPNESIQSALQTAAHRGVKTIIILPEKNDSWIVQCASRSYYRELLNAGVEIYEFTEGLLHSKSLTIDGEFMMIGSANLDRRSFNLNYENSLLISDKGIVSQVIKKQQKYIAKSKQINQDTVNSWSIITQLKNNAIAVLGPIL